MIAADIINQAREMLSDIDGKRWTDAHLLNILNAGQRDIAIRHECVVGIYSQNCDGFALHLDPTVLHILEVYRFNYTPPDSPTGYTAHYTPLKLISKDELRELTGNTLNFVPDETAKVEYIVYDLIWFADSYSNEVGVYPVTGVDVDIDILCSLVPDKSTTYNNLYVPRTYETALVHYVTGKALRVNMDTQNRQFSVEELQLYEAEMARIGSHNMYNGVKHESIHRTKYKGAFNG